MSDARDDEIAKERTKRHAYLLLCATQLELRAHQLILEANELRKLAKRIGELQTSADTLCEATKRNTETV